MRIRDIRFRYCFDINFYFPSSIFFFFGWEERRRRIHWLEFIVPIGMPIITVRKHQSIHGIRCEIFSSSLSQYHPTRPIIMYLLYWLFINFLKELKLIKGTMWEMACPRVCTVHIPTRTHSKKAPPFAVLCVCVCVSIIIWLSAVLSFSHCLSFCSGTFMCWLVFAYVVSDFLIHKHTK